MPADTRPPLEQLYFGAIYSFTVGGRTTAFTFSPARFGTREIFPIDCATWAIITARNPMSVALDEAANLRLDAALQDALDHLNLVSHPACNRARDHSWNEPGRMVPGCTRSQALTLGRRFQQRAVVWTEGEIPGLLDVRTENWKTRPVLWS